MISKRSDVEHATESTQRGRGAREGPVGRVEGGPGRRSDLKLAGRGRGGAGELVRHGRAGDAGARVTWERQGGRGAGF